MDREALLSSIALRIQDYRWGEWSGPSTAHVDRWVRQFDAGVQLGLLSELDHILDRLYISRATATVFLNQFATNPSITGGHPATFWRGVGFLNIQAGGTSQRDMLAEFDQILNINFGYGLSNCQPNSGVYVYLDDAIFSGTRLKNDMLKWLQTAPDASLIHVVVMGLHRGGQWHAETKIKEHAEKLKKQINFTFWRCVELEDRRFYLEQADVLRPTAIPPDPEVQAYVNNLTNAGFPPILRTQNELGQLRVFSTSEARNRLEQEMLVAGVRIRRMCPNLPESMRPLGFTGLRTLGFGSLLVTFRNCPNDCPLAFWVDAPWYPLFPRRTNAQTTTRGNR